MARKLLICLLFVACAWSPGTVQTSDPPTVAPTVAPAGTTGGSTAPPTVTPEGTTEGSTAPPTVTPEGTTGGSTAPPTAPPTVTPEGTTGGSTAPPTVTPEGTTGGSTAPPTVTPEGTTGGSTAPPTVTPAGTTEPPTEPPKGPCDSNSCPDGSTCEERANNTYICLCSSGEYYDGDECLAAKVFPGELTYSKNYEEDMDDNTSPIFEETAEEIANELKAIYDKDPSKKYLDSVVTKLSKATPPSATRTAAKTVATVDIIFDKESSVTVDEVINDIQSVGDFLVTDYCVSDPCDTNSTECKNTTTGYTCECKPGYVEIDFTDKLCVACPNGMKEEGGKCIACDFGYTGSNCEDNWQMILVIVGVVLGALLLVTTILLPVVAMKSKKKAKKAKASKKEKAHSNPAPAKTPQVSNGLAAPMPTPVKAIGPVGGLSGFGANGVPRIPRAKTNDSWDRNTNLEMMPSNSRQNLLPSGRNSSHFDDDEDSNPYSRPMKPQNNPYAMRRPQVNPYASNQAHSNPYYRD